MIRHLIDFLAVPACATLIYDGYIHFFHKPIPFYFSADKWKKICFIAFVICILSILT